MEGDLLTKSAIDIYRSLDTNGDGSLDKDEVRASLAKFGYSEEDSMKILNALDKDGDGTISFEEFLCHFCEESVGSLFCEQCNASLCEACNKQLHSRGAWKGHFVKPIIGGKIQKRRMCPDHPSEYISQCCITCLTLCCAHCFLDGKHSAHQSRDVDLVYEEVKARVQKKLAMVQSQVMVAKEAIAEVDDAQRELHQCSDDLRANVTTGCQRIRGVLDERQQSCMQTVTEIKGAKGVNLYEAQKDMEHKRDRLAVGVAAAEKSLSLSVENQYDFIQDAPQLEADLVMLEELDVTLRGADAAIERVVRFDASERAMKQLELRKADDAGFAQSPASTMPVRPAPAMPARSAAPMSASMGATPKRSSTIGAAASPGDNLSKSAIYVNGLPNNATEADIVEAFRECGGIKMVNARHIASGGFAFVFFDTDSGAENALARARVNVKGKQVNVLAKKQIPGT